jgi:hypothetical protein
MSTSALVANSKAKVQILRNTAVWEGFDKYFENDWQAREMRRKLVYADVALPFVGEWAIFSFHELGKQEAKSKRERGEELKRAQKGLIESCKRTVRAHSTYASLPNFAPGTASVTEAFSRLVEQGVLQTQIARQLLDRAEKGAIFDSRRLGSNWNGVYLALLKHYISAKTGWHRAEIMGAITHLVTAAHDALRRRPPANLRVLLQKAIRHFEENPDNATINYLVKSVVLNPQQLSRMFPRVRISPQSAL